MIAIHDETRIATGAIVWCMCIHDGASVARARASFASVVSVLTRSSSANEWKLVASGWCTSCAFMREMRAVADRGGVAFAIERSTRNRGKTHALRAGLAHVPGFRVALSVDCDVVFDDVCADPLAAGTAAMRGDPRLGVLAFEQTGDRRHACARSTMATNHVSNPDSRAFDVAGACWFLSRAVAYAPLRAAHLSRSHDDLELANAAKDLGLRVELSRALSVHHPPIRGASPS